MRPTNEELALARCASYQRAEVEAQVHQLFSQLGGVGRFIRPGMRVLLKVNLLSPVNPEKAVTTHPEVVRALAQLIQEAGGIVSIGDSSAGIIPGGNRTARALNETGMVTVASQLGCQLVNFDAAKVSRITNPRGRGYEDLYISQAVLDSDLVISVPKLKTHNLTIFTGAVKNLYGCIPGSRKAWYHRIAPNLESFSEYLVDLLAVIRPGLAVMDGITAMEGDGPSAGNPRQVGVLMAGTDLVAVDAVACRLVGIDPRTVLMLRKAEQRGLGRLASGDLERSDLFAELRVSGFRARRRGLRLPAFLTQRALDLLEAYPLVDQQACSGCRLCYNSCPVKTIRWHEGKARIDQQDCIRCYCCQELCPQKAITLTASPLVRILQLLQERRQRS